MLLGQYVAISRRTNLPTLLNANRPNHFEVGQPHQQFFHTVHLQRAHAAVDGAGEQFDDSGALLEELFSRVVGNHQLAQAYAAFVAGLVALVAAQRRGKSSRCRPCRSARSSRPAVAVIRRPRLVSTLRCV